MKNIEVGQVVFVSKERSLLRSVEPNIVGYEVVRVNGTSFYAKGLEDGRELRFNRRTLKSKEPILMEEYKAYKTSEEYWEMIEEGIETGKAIKSIKEKVDKLSLEDLKKLQEYLKGLK